MLDKDGKLRKKFSVLCNIMHHTQDKRPCLTTSRRELEIWCIMENVWQSLWCLENYVVKYCLVFYVSSQSSVRKKMAAVHVTTIPCEPNTVCKVQGKPHFCSICSCAIEIVYAGFEDFRMFLCIFISVF